MSGINMYWLAPYSNCEQQKTEKKQPLLMTHHNHFGVVLLSATLHSDLWFLQNKLLKSALEAKYKIRLNLFNLKISIKKCRFYKLKEKYRSNSKPKKKLPMHRSLPQINFTSLKLAADLLNTCIQNSMWFFSSGKIKTFRIHIFILNMIGTWCTLTEFFYHISMTATNSRCVNGKGLITLSQLFEYVWYYSDWWL